MGRILRELIELAERDEDAELVDALHDAFDVASPGGPNGNRGGAGARLPCSEGCLSVAGARSGAVTGCSTIEVDDGSGFRRGDEAEVDAALRQRELFGAVEYPVRRVGPEPQAGGRSRDAPTGLMPDQKLAVPLCARRENGHLWRFDRERSTEDCQADVCQACGLVRMTSYRTGQVVRYAGAEADDDA